MIRLLIASLAAVLLSGCAAFGGTKFANRIAVTLATDECRADLRAGDYGFSTDIDKRDCEVIREAMRLRALQDYMREQQAQK